MGEQIKNLDTTHNLADSACPSPLIQLALDIKMAAINKDDEIIWKIRTGYLAILYTALTFLIGIAKVENMGNLARDKAVSLSMLFLILGFSMSAFSIDFGYLRKKLRVIVLRDMLIDIAFDPHCKFREQQHKLLHIAAERPLKKHFPHAQKKYRQKLWWNFWWIVLPIYATTPVLAVAIFVVYRLLFH